VVVALGEPDLSLEAEDRPALLRPHEEPESLVDEGALRPDTREAAGLADELVVQNDVRPHSYTSPYILAGVQNAATDLDFPAPPSTGHALWAYGRPPRSPGSGAAVIRQLAYILHLFVERLDEDVRNGDSDPESRREASLTRRRRSEA